MLVVIVEARVEGHPQEILAQPHRLGPEYPGVHQARLAHDRLKIHPVEDVVLDVDPGRDLDQLQTLPCEPEHAALGDIENVLAVLSGIRAGKGAVLDLADELLVLAIALDQQLALDHRNLEVARCQRAAEHHLLRVLADVDEAAGAGQPRAELADVEVALSIRLRKAEEGDVKAPAVVEVELVGLVDDGLRVHRGAEVQPAGRNAADHSGLGGQGDEVDDVFLGGHRGHALGHADAEVDHRIRAQLERRAARDDLSFGQRHRRHVAHGHADLAGEGGAEGLGEGLLVVLGLLGDDHAVDHHAGHLHLPRRQRMRVGHALDLRDDDAAGVARGHRDGQRFERERLALHRQVAVGVGGGGADQRDVDRKGLVEQVLVAVDFHQAHELLLRLLIDLPTAEARVDEGAQAHLAQVARLAGGDVAEQVRDHALRQVPGLDAAGHRELLQRGHQAPVAADDARHQPVVAEVVEAALLAVALAGGVDQCQAARRGRFEEAGLERHRQVLGETDADEAAGGHRVAVGDQPHGIGGADHLAAMRALPSGHATTSLRMLRHVSPPSGVDWSRV